MSEYGYNSLVLLAISDEELRQNLSDALEGEGFSVRYSINGIDALRVIRESKFDLCIIDSDIPLKNGYEVTQEMRVVDNRLFIILLIETEDHDNIRKGFNAGCDDVVVKPMDIELLLMRIKAMRRRCKSMHDDNSSTFEIGLYKFDHKQQTLSYDDKYPIKLTTREADLLRLLCVNKNDVLERGTALKKIWYDDSYFNARCMDVYIAKLRKYLSRDKNVEIVNIHGIGFKMMEQQNSNKK